MSLQLSIDGTDYDIRDGTLEIQLNKGVAGCSLSCELMPGSPIPETLKPVVFDALGVEFNGHTVSLPDNPKPGRTSVRVTALGPQIKLKGNPVDYSARNKNVSDILADLLFQADIDLGGVVLTGDHEIYGFTFKGPFLNALQALAEKAGLEFWISPNEGIVFVDPLDRPAAGQNWEVGEDTGFAEPSRNVDHEFPPNRIIIKGGVQPPPGFTDPDEVIEYEEASDGEKQWYRLPETADNLEQVTVDGGDPLTIAEDTTTEAETSDVVFYPKRFGREIWFWLRNKPTAGDLVAWSVRFQYARGQADDEDAQEEFGAIFTEEVEMPEVRTTEEANQIAAAILKLRKIPRVSATALVFDGGAIFKPCEGVTHTDPRRPSFPSGLGVVTNVLRQAPGREAWLQTVTIGNEAAQPRGLLGLALELTSKTGRTPQVKTPATYTPAASSPNFTIACDPTTINRTDGTNTPIEVEVEIAAVNGFTGSVSLNKTGLTGVTCVFDPPVITGGSGTSTATLTPVGNWVDTNVNQEGSLMFRGASGTLLHSTAFEIVIDEAPECGDYAGYALDIDCSEIPPNCCDLPRLDLDEDPIEVPWSVEFFDNCEPPNVIGTASGTMAVGRDVACGVITTGDEFTDPDDVTHSVFDPVEGCTCVVA